MVDRRASKKVLAWHETVNKRLKEFKVLKQQEDRDYVFVRRTADGVIVF